MSDDDLAARLSGLLDKLENERFYDEENLHGEADDLLCEALEALGFAKSVAVFRELPKWYA